MKAKYKILLGFALIAVIGLVIGGIIFNKESVPNTEQPYEDELDEILQEIRDSYPKFSELRSVPTIEFSLLYRLIGDKKYYHIELTDQKDKNCVIDELIKSDTCDNPGPEYEGRGYICFETDPPHGTALEILKAENDDQVYASWGGHVYFKLKDPNAFIALVKKTYSERGKPFEYNTEFRSLFEGVTKIEYKDLEDKQSDTFGIVITDKTDIKTITDAIANGQKVDHDHGDCTTFMVLHAEDKKINLDQAKGKSCFSVLIDGEEIFKGVMDDTYWPVIGKYKKVKSDKDEIDSGVGLEVIKSIRKFKYTGINDKLVLWNGKQAYLFDSKEERWKRIANNPNVYKGDIKHGLAQYDDSNVLAVYWKELYGLCFDLYDIQTDTWKSFLRIPREGFVPPHELNPLENPGVISIAVLPQETIVFLRAADAKTYSKNIGVRVEKSAKYYFTPMINAPRAPYYKAATYAKGNKLLFWGYNHITANVWSIVDLKNNVWLKPRNDHPNYDYGHCFSGDEVYIFGGAWSSAEGIIIQEGKEFSFERGSWELLPKNNAPKGRRNFAMHWIGDKIFVWGGWGGESGFNDEFYSDGALYDPANKKWSKISLKDAPSARMDMISVWTGKEVLILGGTVLKDNWVQYFDMYAYNPKTDQWRKLPAFK